MVFFMKLKKQNVRSLLIFTSFLLFPITQWYFSPFLILYGATEGIINGSFLVFSIMILIGFFFGRGACGWIMPCGGFQECFFAINDKKTTHTKMYLLKYILWGIWISCIAFFAIRAGGYHEINPFFHIPNGISIDAPWKYIIYYLVVFIFFFTSLLCGKRAGCHYFCWICPFMLLGRKLRNLLHTPALQLKAEPDKCINCKLCERECPMSLPVHDMVKENRMENSECILCAKCESACPKQVIHMEFGRPASKK